MENAAKALLIAAAVLIAVMLLSMVFIFWDDMAGYFTERHDATMLEQLVKFNNKFQNYNGKNVRGNELISIMNSIIDYNNYQAGVEGYDRIIIEIDLLGHENDFKYNNESGGNTLISSGMLVNNKISNKNNDGYIKTIAEAGGRLVANSGISEITDVKLQKLVAQISSIVDDAGLLGADLDDYKKNRKATLESILKRTVDESEIETIKTATYQYNQFTQFKKAMFECTNISYNETNGIVNRMQFRVILKDNGTIKFDD